MDPASPNIGGPIVEHNINFPGLQFLSQGLQTKQNKTKHASEVNSRDSVCEREE